MLLRNAVSCLAIGLGFLAFSAKADAQENVMVVFDGSNSMWGQIEGVSKIEIARDMIGDLLGGWTEDRQVGLMAYGHRRRGDCGDIETLVEPQSGAAADIIERVQSISPRGKTPLTDAVEQAANALSFEDTPATVVLISDGLESCERDPCELARALETGGVGFTAHVVGFGLGSDQDVGSLSCLAEETGGIFIEASNASELKTALSDLSTAVAKDPEPAREPEPESELPNVTVTGPETAVGGSDITVAWDPTIDARDMITVVPVGTAENTWAQHIRAGETQTGTITVVGQPGDYEVRYLGQTSEVLGRAPLQITEPQVALTAPDEVPTGAVFDLSWTPTIHPNDFLTIVPLGSRSADIGEHVRTRDTSDGRLTAPSDPGTYELRYVLGVDRTLVAARRIEVTEASVAVDGPITALTGSVIAVEWSPTMNPADFITIVSADQPGDTIGNHIRTRDTTSGVLTTPAEPGLYEVRYVLNGQKRTIGSHTLELVEPEVTLSAPETASVGSRVGISWTGSVNGFDYVTVVAAGAAEGTIENHIRVRDKTTGEVQMPSDPGLYELRYVLAEGRKTAASTMIELTQSDVTLTVADTAVIGSLVTVSWAGAVNGFDYVTVVSTDAPEGTIKNHTRVRNKTSDDVQMPSEPGVYELRYVLAEGRKTAATARIELTDANVTLTVPKTALSGSKIAVRWTGSVNGYDYVTIVPVGTAEGEIDDHIRVRRNTSGELQAPGDTGLYEVRYVLAEGKKTLARAQIELTKAEVTISGPETVRTGEAFEVRWTGAVHANDYVTIVPAGSEQGESGYYAYVRSVKSKTLRAPAETGLYELRYVLNEGDKTLATAMIEVVAADVTVSAPAAAVTGQNVMVSWTGQVSGNDFITVVPKGSAEGTSGNYFYVRQNAQKELTMPGDAGLYEVRYVLSEGDKIMARTDIEVTSAQVSLEGPAQIRAGDEMTVTWSPSVHPNDYVVLVPMGSLDDASDSYFYVRNGERRKMDAPDSPGLYELRYILNEGRKVLARQTVDVVPETAALNDGALINAPEMATAGSTVAISWKVDKESADQRLTLATPDQAIFTWITAQKMNGVTAANLTMPETPGIYELRILDVTGQAVLAQKMISVE